MLGLAAAVSQDDTMQSLLKAPRLTSTDKATTFNDVVTSSTPRYAISSHRR